MAKLQGPIELQPEEEPLVRHLSYQRLERVLPSLPKDEQAFVVDEHRLKLMRDQVVSARQVLDALIDLLPSPEPPAP